MTIRDVEWVLAVRVLLSHHKTLYGRLGGKASEDKSFNKDYIQLSQMPEFLTDLERTFGRGSKGRVPLTFKWRGGSAQGKIVMLSSDRPHLSWETRDGAPIPWRMSLSVGPDSVETIPGDPSHQRLDLASREYELLDQRGAGQPYLLAVKLRDDPGALHLRAYLEGAAVQFGWASADLLPPEVRALLDKTSKRSALAWRRFDVDGAPGRLRFDPDKNHDAWNQAEDQDQDEDRLDRELVDLIDSDAAAETLPTLETEVEEFRIQIEDGNFEVADTRAYAKTRGNAQRAFSERVKKNYQSKCAVSGISTKAFLVGAHIVPWSHDKTIRLDPANGICLSVLLDKAFELGFILIDDDLTIRVNHERLKEDARLADILRNYDGLKLNPPLASPPNPNFLKRRRNLVNGAPS